MKNIKEFSIRWIGYTAGYFAIRNILELINPMSNSEYDVKWIALEAILFGIIMTAFELFRQHRKNKQSNKTTDKTV